MHKRTRTTETPVQPLLLTVTQVATLLNVGRSTVYELIRREGLPSVSLGGRNTRVAKASLEQWIAERERRLGA